MKEIIKTYQNTIKHKIRQLTGTSNEDLEQEVYIKTWKNLGRYKEEGKFKQWINTITYNTCKDFLKSSSHKNQALSDGEDKLVYIKDSKNSPDKKILQKERQKIIADAIEKLKPKLKEVIILSDIKDMNYEEISKKLNVPQGTVKSRLFNARQQLSEVLKDLL